MKRSKLVPLFTFALITLASAPVVVLAQTDAASTAPALPVVPGAEKAASSQAPASLPAAPGSSPLEPYLITWLLPVAGIGSAAFALWVDKKMRAGGASTITTRS